MSVAYRSTGSPASSSSTASAVLGKPTGTAEGDILVALIARTGGTTADPNSVPADWSLVADTVNTARGFRYWVYTKTATASEPDTYTWGWAAALKTRGAISAFSGATAATTLTAGTPGRSEVLDTAVLAPGITAGACLLVFLGAAGRTVTTTYTPPTDFTERHDAGDINSDLWLTVGSRDWAGGATGDITATTSGTSNNKGGVLLAFGEAVEPSYPTTGRTFGATPDAPGSVAGYRYHMNFDVANPSAAEGKNFAVNFPAAFLATKGKLRSDYADVRVATADGTVLPCSVTDWALTVGYPSMPLGRQTLYVWFGGGATPPSAPSAGSAVVLATDPNELVDTEGSGYTWLVWGADLETTCLSQAAPDDFFGGDPTHTVGKGTSSDEWKLLVKPFIGALPIGQVTSAKLHLHLASTSYAENGNLYCHKLSTVGVEAQSFAENVGSGWSNQGGAYPTWNKRFLDYQASDTGVERGWYGSQAGCGPASYSAAHVDLALASGFTAAYHEFALTPAWVQGWTNDDDYAQGLIVRDPGAAGAADRKATVAGSLSATNKPVLEVTFSDYATDQLFKRKLSTNTYTYATFSTQDRYAVTPSTNSFGVMLYTNAEMRYDVCVISHRGRIKRVVEDLAPTSDRFDFDGQCGGLEYDAVEGRFYTVGNAHSTHTGRVLFSAPYVPTGWTVSGAMPRVFYKGQLVAINGVVHLGYSDGAGGDIYHTRYTRSTNAFADTGMVVTNGTEAGYCQYVILAHDATHECLWLVWTLALSSPFAYDYVACARHDYADADNVWHAVDGSTLTLPAQSSTLAISDPLTDGYPEDVNVLTDGTVIVLYGRTPGDTPGGALGITDLKCARLAPEATAFVVSDIGDMQEASSCDFEGGTVAVTGVLDPEGTGVGRRSMRSRSEDYGATFSAPEVSASYDFPGGPLWLSGSSTAGNLGFGIFYAMHDAHHGAIYLETADAPSAPLDPSGFTATEDGADVVLAWTDNATNETGYYLEEAHDWTGDDPAAEDWSPVATIAADATTYTDTPTYTTRIRYRIAAGNASGLSAWVESNTLGAALVAVVADASADAAAPTITQGVTSALAGATAAASAPSITAALTAAVAAAVGEAGTGTPLHSIAAALATATGEAITASITQAVAAVVAHAVGIAGAAAAPFGWARRDTDASEWTQRGTESGVWAKRDTDSSTWTRR